MYFTHNKLLQTLNVTFEDKQLDKGFGNLESIALFTVWIQFPQIVHRYDQIYKLFAEIRCQVFHYKNYTFILRDSCG